MAQEKTIPVRVRTGSYGDEGKLHQLSYDTRVLLARGLPALDQIDILPFVGNNRRAWVQPGQLSKHYEIRYIKDLRRTWWEHTRVSRIQGVGHLRNRKLIDRADPAAGTLVTRLSPVKLLKLPAGTLVLCLVNDRWEVGLIEDYVDQIQAKRVEEKTKKKAKYKHRKYLRQPTIWDRISRD
jgi:hypothetical protein